MRPVERPEKPPQVEVVPPADGWERAAEALNIAELAGLGLDDWQQYCLWSGLGTLGGKWSAFEVALVVSRQNGKTEVLVARILVDLFTQLADPRLTIFAAHEYKTAREVFLRLKGLLDMPADADPLFFADESLREQVKTIRTANGEESIELHNGRRVRFLARTSGSGRGFTGDTVILDESYKLTAEQMSALVPTMGARPDPQLWYASMGPFEDSEQQLAVMDRAKHNPSRLCYLGWQAPDDADVDDQDWWVACNPAHPHRVTLEQLKVEREALGELGFAREKLCMTVSSVSRVIPEAIWKKVLLAVAEPAGDLVFGLDMNPERTAASIGVADTEGRVELADFVPLVGDVIPSASRWASQETKILDRVVGMCQKHSAPVVVDATGPAGSLIPDLESRGVEVVSYTGRDLANACGRFFDMVVDGALSVRPHELLEGAVAGAIKRTVGDSWAWGRRQSTVDISPLVAVTLAVDAAVKPDLNVADPGLLVYTLD